MHPANQAVEQQANAEKGSEVPSWSPKLTSPSNNLENLTLQLSFERCIELVATKGQS